MDWLLGFGVGVVCVCAVLVMMSFSGSEKDGLPGSKGWPIVGENVEFLYFGAHKFVKNKMEKHSGAKVFQSSFLGERVAVFCGAQGNKFLFGKLDTIWWPKSMKRVTLFPEYADQSFSSVLALTHSLHADIFMPDALRRYIPIMDHVASQHMDNHWPPINSVVMKMFPLIKKYSFTVAAKSFMSLSDPHHIAYLFHPFSNMLIGMCSMPINFPGMAYNGAMRGGRVARREVVRIINDRRRRKEETRGRDVLSKMLVATDENGRFFSEMEIANNIISLILASLETSSSTIATVMNNLAHMPHVYQHLLKEQMEVARSKEGPDELLTWEDIEKMKYTWNVVRETMRLTPPAPGVLKEITTDITYDGYTIPKGWKAYWTTSSHMNPDYFPEPHKFDPSRFEGRGPAPFTFVPFGGGRGMCPGREFARLEILIFLHNLVTRFKFQNADFIEKFVSNPVPTPLHDLPLRLHPHQK